jgi:hypothetical protein
MLRLQGVCKVSQSMRARCSDACGDGKPLDMAGEVADVVRSVFKGSETAWTASERECPRHDHDMEGQHSKHHTSSCDPTTH